MSIESWFAFASASLVLRVIPGPTILLVLAAALCRGWRTPAPVAVGVALGDITATTRLMPGVRTRRLAARPRALRRVNRAGGTARIGAGAATALSARAA